MTHFITQTIITLGLLAIFGTAFADETTIVNSVSSSANTGGNIAESGEVIEGEARSSVFIETEIDGEVIERIEETSTSSSVEVHHEVVVNEKVVTSTSSVTDNTTSEEHTGTKETEQTEAETEQEAETTAIATTSTSVEIEDTSVFARIKVFISYVFSFFGV